MKRTKKNSETRSRGTAATRATVRKADPPDKPSQTSTRPFLIVGVGASAGGLEAFTQLLKHLPPDTGLGFVLVQHLDPQHDSALSQLLARATSMPVREVTNNLRVERDHIYVIPPNTNLAMSQGVLKLQPRVRTGGAVRSIDFFFESLAQDQHERAIGVILSGTATDGTLGLEAIKAEGGITFVQDNSAKYDSMPRSAIAAGCVDWILSPEKIAKELAQIAKHPYLAGDALPAELEREAHRHKSTEGPLAPGGDGTPRSGWAQAWPETEATPNKAGGNDFRKVLVLLRSHCGVDFSLYKSTTIQRRVTRRIVLNKQKSLEGYARFLRGNAKELDALYSDVLISVTSFFRNPEAFEVLKRKVFPGHLQRGDEPFRVWVLGCSTGQEAYSIAMAFMESTENSSRARKLQVFATDLNEALLEKARHGLYARSLVEGVSPERLRRFFVEEQGGYRILKALRETVVFARQNLINDPPFSRMDLISCRNLLIYLDPSLQKKALPTFHYALKPGGCLFLGPSETIGGFTDLFEPLDKKHKIYSRKAAPTPALHLPQKRGRPEKPRFPFPIKTGHAEPPAVFRTEVDAQREADRLTINQFAPPGVLINADLQILQFRGVTNAWLEPPTGTATFDLLKMAREGLKLPLRAAIHKAKKENQTVRKKGIRVEQNGGSRMVDLEVIPLKNLRERCFLILFEDGDKGVLRKETKKPAKEPASLSSLPLVKGSSVAARRVAHLERELSETRDYLQSIQEQYEASNEELQASNEEVQSANEELQSVNEELETSKEELESANEELTTVNEEMAHRNTELAGLNADLINLQTSTKLPIVLLGRDLTIRRFSAAAEKLFNLLATDLGRPIAAVRHNLDMADLEDFIAEVIGSVREREREVRDKKGRWYSLRVRPYLTLDNKVDGAVLVLVDLDELKRSEQQIKAARDFAEAIIRTGRDPLVILDARLHVHSANDAFYKTFKVTPRETENVLIYELDGCQWNIPQLRRLLEEIILRKSFFNNFEVTHDFDRIGRRTMLLDARRLDGPSGEPERILLGIEDITERRKAEQAALAQAQLAARADQLEALVAERTARLKEVISELQYVSYAMVHDMRGPLRAMEGFAQCLESMFEESTPEERANYLRRIGSAATRLDKLIQDALNYNKAVLQDTVLRPVDLSVLIRDLLDTYPNLDPEKADIIVEGRLPVVIGNEALLTQCFSNLLGNAVKFVAPGERPRVRVWAESVSESAEAGSAPRFARISVEDHGIGIEKQAQARLFQMFQRLTAGYEGTGMGLAIVRKLVDRMHGKIGADSEPGKGSRFWIELELAQ